MIKKLLIGVLMIACVGMLFACGSNDENTSEALQGNENEEEVASEVLGTLYPLEYAYEQGFLTAEEVRSIGYYYNGGKEWVECECGLCDDEEYSGNKCYEGFKETDYQPIAKNPTELSASSQERIKQTYIDLLYSTGTVSEDGISKNEMKAKMSKTIEYYGTYNGYVAIRIVSSGGLPTHTTSTVAGIVFNYPYMNPMLVWKENR